MALYVSCGHQVLVQVRAEEPKTNNKGDIIGKHPRLFAQFQRGIPAAWAEADAIAKLNFAGLPENVHPRERMGTFDSVIAQEIYGWTDEERVVVEETLDEMQGAPAQFVRVEFPKIPAPWPAIENLRPHGRRTVEISAEKLVEANKTFGFDPEILVAYLSQEGWDQRVVNLVSETFARLNAEEPADELVAA